MPLAFLVPAFLAGFAALAVPIMLHLRRRERERPMVFPSLMFLKKIPFATARRRRITDLPLLLLRSLIVLLAVLAFARPFIKPRPESTAHKGAKRVVLAIDRSMSMGHKAVWSAALDSARAVLDQLAGDDRVAVVAFDEDASVLQPMSIDHAAARAALDQVKPVARGTRYAAGIRAGREVLEKEPGLGGSIVVVTDLQRSGSGGLVGLTLPANVQVRAVSATAKPHGNTGIAALEVQRMPGDERSRLAVSARLITRGLTAARKVHLVLSINGRPNGARDVTLQPEGTQSVPFDAVTLPAGEVRLTVTADADSLTTDDSFSAVVPPEVSRRVILITAPEASADETFFLEHALTTGRSPALKVERRTAASLDVAILRDAAAVILDDVAPPSGAAGTALLGYVRAGGGVIAVGGPRLGGRNVSPALLPGAFRGMVERRDERGAIIGDAALDHPVFAAFRAGGNAALGSAHFFRYPRIAATADASVLARFDDGNPAVLERKEGEGRVILDVTPLDAISGDFPLQPAYLPFLRNLALYAAGHAAAPFWRTTGEAYLVPPAAQNPVVKAPSGDLWRPEAGPGERAAPFAEAGFYTVYDGRPSGEPLAVVAVNPPPRESDLTPMDPRELLVGVGIDSSAASSLLDPATLAQAESRQRVWRWLLLLAAAALVLETVIASRGWRGTAAQIVGAGMEGSER
jgi:hypothetical protein